MDRRRFLLLALAGALASPPITEAQRPGKVYRIGFISNGGHRTHDPLRAAFLDGLRELGWVEATNVTMEVRWAEGDLRRHPQLTRDLVAREVDVIVLAGTAAARAATEATRTIPIVVTAVGDPVTAGLVSSLARPGGNLTGLAWQASDLVTKQLQLLQEISPVDDRLAVLAHASNPSARAAVEGAARTLGLKFDVIDIDAPAAISAAFERIQRSRATMLLVLPSPMFFAERRRLTELAARSPRPGRLRGEGVRRRRRSAVLRSELPDHVPAGGELRRSDLQGRSPQRPANGAADEVRVEHQREDGPDARPADSSIASAASRPGCRVNGIGRTDHAGATRLNL
jgi:putative tryptophan/tyrosine transport system substrate-binding protein